MLTLNELQQRSIQLLPEVQRLFALGVEELPVLFSVRGKQREYFAPIYASNVCGSRCSYCAFHKGSGVQRITLTPKQAVQEALFLKERGYDSVYCLSGSFPEKDITKIGSMTEVNARVLRALSQVGLFPVLESSPFSQKNLESLLKSAGDYGRYVLFMETYNREAYRELHGGDPYKGDPERRLQQVELAFAAGWQELGIGALLGLNKEIPREIASVVAHCHYLQKECGVHKVTISVPRVNSGTDVEASKWKVSDETFIQAVFVLQALCPDAWIVLTGRESIAMRDRLIPHINQCIIGARGSTVPGGYTLGNKSRDGQFELVDKRSVEELQQKYR